MGPRLDERGNTAGTPTVDGVIIALQWGRALAAVRAAGRCCHPQEACVVDGSLMRPRRVLPHWKTDAWYSPFKQLIAVILI